MYRPLEERLQLYDLAKQLWEQGLSYNQVAERIHSTNGVQLSESQIGCWVRGDHTPLGKLNTFDAKPSPPLAYIIGVKASDGYIYNHRFDHEFALRVSDFYYTETTGQNLAKLLEQKKPYKPRWDKWNGRWHVKCSSVLLYRFLEQPLENLRPYVEHCRECAASFLGAFSDGEASIRGSVLILYNTDKGLLLYIQFLLRRYFRTETTGPHRDIMARSIGTRKTAALCTFGWTAYQVSTDTLAL